MTEKKSALCGYTAYRIDAEDYQRLNDANCFGDICDECNKSITVGVYVPALNHVMCDDCFASWCAISSYYEDDIEYEQLNIKWFESWCKYLSIKMQFRKEKTNVQI